MEGKCSSSPFHSKRRAVTAYRHSAAVEVLAQLHPQGWLHTISPASTDGVFEGIQGGCPILGGRDPSVYPHQGTLESLLPKGAEPEPELKVAPATEDAKVYQGLFGRYKLLLVGKKGLNSSSLLTSVPEDHSIQAAFPSFAHSLDKAGAECAAGSSTPPPMELAQAGGLTREILASFLGRNEPNGDKTAADDNESTMNYPEARRKMHGKAVVNSRDSRFGDASSGLWYNFSTTSLGSWRQARTQLSYSILTLPTSSTACHTPILYLHQAHRKFLEHLQFLRMVLAQHV